MNYKLCVSICPCLKNQTTVVMFIKKANRRDIWSLEPAFERFSTNNLLSTLVLSCLYFVWYSQVVGLRSEHWVLYGILLVMYFAHPQTRQFIKAFAIFVVYWIIYDSLRVVPNYTVNPVHIQEPYGFEKQYFGITVAGVRHTWNEYFAQHHQAFFDVLSGLFYINWVPIPLALGVYLLFNNKPLFFRFAYCFVFVNMLGFVLYYLYPAAPPWYVAAYGFEPNFTIGGNVAGLKYFDEILNVQIFHGIYQKNANVFAAMPSLHSAYPLIVLYYGRMLKIPWLTVGFNIFCLGIWWAAVYTSHHYIIDVLAGIACATLGIVIFEKYLQSFVLKLANNL